MLATIHDLCKNGRELTEDTQFMIKMMEESKTLEEAMAKIVRKVDFISKLIRRNVRDCMQMSEFTDRLIRNYMPLNLEYFEQFSMINIDNLTILEPKNEASYIFDHILMSLFP